MGELLGTFIYFIQVEDHFSPSIQLRQEESDDHIPQSIPNPWRPHIQGIKTPVPTWRH